GRAAIAKQEQSKRLYGWASSAVKSAAKAGDRLGFMGMLSRGVKGAERAASMTTTRRTSGERYFMGGHVRYDALHPTRRLMRESKIRRIEDDIRRRIKRVVPNASKEDLDSAMRGEGQKGLSGFEKAASRRSLYRSRHGLTRGANKEAAGLITERLRERGVRREGEHTYHDLPTKSESDNPRHRRRSPNSPGDGREGYRPMRFRPEHTPQPAEKPEQPSRSVFDFYIEPIDEETANQELLEQQPVEEDQEVIARK
ncbi:MAG: hypothetical protein R3313_04320, partial [Candidatus Saccharimonadales bacterium]|nr:hypothetical protein [Candidatus Saccharimonadales bacterium]